MRYILFLSMLCSVLFAQLSSAETTLEKAKKAGVLTVGTSAAYAPFEFRQGGELVGFDIDLGQEMAKRMGLEIKWVEIDFKGIIAALKSGRVDMLITAMTKTPERAKQIDFSEPYFDAGIVAAVPEGSKIKKPEDLEGMIVGVQLGTSGERYVRNNLSGLKEIKTYDTILLALKDLEAGRVQAVVNPGPAIRYNARSLKNIQVTDPWVSRSVGINTRKEDKDLMQTVNKHLTELKNEGFLKALEKKWFGIN